MCGIVGFVDINNRISAPHEVLKTLCNSLLHRGPDGTGTWENEDESVFLGHLRLSILDLSNAAGQPMFSSSGRYVIIFNGEIYNYLEIKEELLSNQVSFKTTSDTEVIVNAIEVWGVRRTLDKLAGMFAFVVWDRTEQKLTLVRDRVGEKPIYYGCINGVFFFCSELNAIKGVPYFQTEIDETAVVDFFKYSYIPAPKSIFKGIYKLLPASFIEITPTELKGVDSFQPNVNVYWQPGQQRKQQYTDLREASEQLNHILKKVVSQQMLSDVPLGAFLSGGVDSSLVVSVMQKISASSVHTFSVGFEDERYNEAPFAKKVAEYLGTIHHEYIFTNKDLEELITTIPGRFDEPFGDSSQIPTYIVARFAKSHVTVSLSGDGGDEVFGGYTKYLRGKSLHQQLQRVPKVVAKVLNASLKPFSSILSGSNGGKISNFLRMSDIHDVGELYDALSTNYISPQLLTYTGKGNQSVLLDTRQIDSLEEEFMYRDFKTYLPDDIMVKVDRMAMAVSLETRAPFLDKRIVEFMSSLDLKYKIDDQELKILPKLLLGNYIPESLFNRPKKGFSVPLKTWFMSRDNKFIDHVFIDLGKMDKYVNHGYALTLLEKHRQNKIDASSVLWNIYVWYLWSQQIM